MSFQSISILLVCEGVRLERVGEYKVLKSKLKIFIPLIEFIADQKMSFNSKLRRFSKNFSFQANLDENSNSFVLETISGFCSSLWIDSN